MNIKNGMTKVFKAELLQLLAVVTAFIAQILSATGYVSYNRGLVQVAVVFLFAAFVVFLWAMVLYCKGLSEAKNDNERFGIAQTLIIVRISVSIIGAIFSFVPVLGSVISLVCKLANAVIYYFLVRAIVDVCEEICLKHIARGKNAKIAAFIYMIASIMSTIFGVGSGAGTIAYVVIFFIFFMLYLSFIAKYMNRIF